MTDIQCCESCFGADPNRKDGDKIRCRCFSEWVEPTYICSAYFPTDKVREILRKREQTTYGGYVRLTEDNMEADANE